MIPTKIDFPVFEANQVLTNEHLNSVRIYLDEQNRLTRASLHGIGIVCGLEVRAANSGNSVTVGKGYGVTSEGYLAIVGNEDFVGDRFRKYIVPNGGDYALLMDVQSETKPLLELLEKGHDNYESGEAITSGVLNGKAVILFIELLEENLKNCSPSSCDDKGKKVTVNCLKLLIDKSALETLNANIKSNVETAKAQGDFFPDLTARLDLPDLRLPRLDLNLSVDVDAQAIFAAYRAILSKTFFDAIGEALDEAYLAFQPIIPALPSVKYLSETLNTIYNQYDALPGKKDIIFSQYFYDFADDLIQAYDEFRCKAHMLFSLCNPPEELFPRHLELGEIEGSNFAGYKINRHYFRPSPALVDQKLLCREVQQLFRRLRLILDNFELPGASQSGIKIIPSRLGNAALSDKAIPYYYHLTGNSTLLASWNFHKTATGRVSENLGYNVNTQYHREIEPKANSLLYDLENYNFFRIEGHIGLNWRAVLKNLLDQILDYRLPFDVVALNAHPDTIDAAPTEYACLTNDLQIIYDAWSKELQCLLKESVKVVSDYRIPVKPVATSVRARTNALLPFASKVDVLAALSIEDGSLGKIVSDAIKLKQPDVAVSRGLADGVKTLLKDNPDINKLSVADFDLSINKPVELLSSLSGFTEALPVNASELQYATLSRAYRKFTDVTADYIKDLVAYVPPTINPPITGDQKKIILNTLKSLSQACLVERLEVLGAELERRNKQIKELLFFNKFILKHPGLEHKAGVTKGGTFVLVFQETPTDISADDKGSFLTHKLNGELKATAPDKIGSAVLESPSGLKITKAKQNVLTETLANQGIFLPPDILATLNAVRLDALPANALGLPEKVVVADFYLPYRCISNCPPVQFVLPPPRPIFVMEAECQGTDGKVNVKFEFTQRTSPCEVQIDDQPYELLINDEIKLAVGTHKVVVRDAEGGISLPQTLEIFPKFMLQPQEPLCDATYETYTVNIIVTNGRLPLKVDGNEVEATTEESSDNAHSITVGPFNSGESVTIQVGDSSVCPAQALTFDHSCIPLQPQPDTKTTAYNTPLTFNVLENDIGENLTITSAILVDVTKGSVVINADQTITYTPADTVENQDVVINYSVMDQANNSLQTTATVHVSKKPCDLPCKGFALRRGYKLLLPGQNQIGDIKFTIESPANTLINLSEQVKKILFQSKGDIINFAERLNKLIFETTGSSDWLKIDVSPQINDLFDCTIEYYECLKYEFQIRFSTGPLTHLVGSINLTILPDSSDFISVLEDETVIKATIPAYDPVRIDKCNPELPAEVLCSNVPDLSLKIGSEFFIATEGLSTVTLTAIPEGSEEPVAYLWEVQGANPSIANGEKNTFTFFGTTITLQVRLTAFTKQGCRVILNEQISNEIFE